MGAALELIVGGCRETFFVRLKLLYRYQALFRVLARPSLRGWARVPQVGTSIEQGDSARGHPRWSRASGIAGGPVYIARSVIIARADCTG